MTRSSEAAYLESARHHFDNGEPARAAALCDEALVRYPESGRLWELAGTACWAAGDLPGAMAALETASLLVALSPLAQLALASAYAWADKADLARTVFHHLSALPDFPVPLMPRLAAELGRLGEDETALLICEKITELRPGYHPAWFGVAFYRRRLDREWEEITAPLRTALHLAPESLPYRVALAGCLVQQGELEEACLLAQDVPLEAVGCPHWLRLMGRVFALLGDESRSRGCRRRADALGEGPDCPCQ